MLNRSEVDEGLLAAMRRASHDESLTFNRPPRPVNASGSVIFVEPKTSAPHLNGQGVVRLCPDFEVARREAIVQRFLTDHGYPAPVVLLAGTADDELGGRWLLIEQISGSAVRIGGWRNPKAGLKSLVALWQRPGLLADLSARLHSIDPAPLGADLESHGAAFDWFRYQWDLVERLQSIGYRDVVDWLTTNRPPDSEPVLSHGDLHPGNVVVDTDGPRVIDWGIGGLAPAARDIACTMFAMLNTGGQAPGPSRLVFSAMGRSFSRRFLKLYRRSSPAAMSDEELNWHRVLYSANRIVWMGTERSGGPVANDQDALAKRASRSAGAVDQELPLHAELIRTITGIDITSA